ncbi:hypothetical protein BC829DRAFT_382699 [Chytridium lagenaria]|nr:hypothetical protein BC829DRAFT_382699 [Chytridium lagenaria]
MPGFDLLRRISSFKAHPDAQTSSSDGQEAEKLDDESEDSSTATAMKEVIISLKPLPSADEEDEELSSAAMEAISPASDVPDTSYRLPSLATIAFPPHITINTPSRHASADSFPTSHHRILSSSHHHLPTPASSSSVSPSSSPCSIPASLPITSPLSSVSLSSSTSTQQQAGSGETARLTMNASPSSDGRSSLSAPQSPPVHPTKLLTVLLHQHPFFQTASTSPSSNAFQTQTRFSPPHAFTFGPSTSSSLLQYALAQPHHQHPFTSHHHPHFLHHHNYHASPPFGHISNLADDLYAVAERHLFGLEGEPRDESKGFRMLQRAANYHQGHVQAQAVLGFCLEFGIGTSQDFKAAEKLYLAAAVKGNGLAGARLSFLRRYGRPSVKIDRVEAEEWIKMVQKQGVAAVEWLIKAADQHGFASAEYALGVCYHDGVGVPKDPVKAVVYYKRSAAAGQPRGEGILGYCYGEGFGVDKDEKMAFSLYLSAAQRGESVSMYNVAHCYEEGIGVDKNLEEAIRWYVKSANLGNCYAQNSLGYMYEEGLGVDRDEWMAVHSEQGYPWAQCNLGFCLQNGIGMEKNEELGSFWYQKAAIQGHSRAQHNLGHAYQYGIGVEKDETMAYGIGTEIDEQKAVKLYHESSTLGHAPALVGCYRNGIGVPINEEEAFKWIRLSALGAVYWYNISAKYGNGVDEFAVLYSEGNGAVKLLRLAAEQGHVRAQTRLALHLRQEAFMSTQFRYSHVALAQCFETGQGCKKDVFEAIKYEKASERLIVLEFFT